MSKPLCDQLAIPYGVGSWPLELGNHRARILVDEPAEAVWLHLPWRRRDPTPQTKDIMVCSAATGFRVLNVARLEIRSEYADLVFQAESGPAEYYVYYLPFRIVTAGGVRHGDYVPPQGTADPTWLERHGLRQDQARAGAWRDLPQAKVVESQARTEFDRFDPMEIVATAAETAQILAQHPHEPCMLFPEDRCHPIRMTEALPLRWIECGPSARFCGQAQRGEFYAFQVGIWAARTALDDLHLVFGTLGTPEGATIPASAWKCFNLGGTDFQGHPLRKRYGVMQGRVGALWLGVRVPADAKRGTYRGQLAMTFSGAKAVTLAVELEVLDELLPDAGDSEPWRHSRLRWLDSTIGSEPQVTPPYTPLEVRERTIGCLGRQITLGSSGLPASIQARGREMLASPVTLVVQDAQGGPEPTWREMRLTGFSAAAASWESQAVAGALTLSVQADMDFDGYINYRVAVRASECCRVQDIRLEIPFRRDIAQYMMGLGRKGGYRPAVWRWKWNRQYLQDSVWVGDIDAGLQIKLKGPRYTWPLINIYYHLGPLDLPDAWYNDGQGGCNIEEVDHDRVILRAYSGARELAPGDELRFDWGLLITPVKPLDTAYHWNTRYYWDQGGVEAAVRAGANNKMLEEASPYINYPFHDPEMLRDCVREAHRAGLKTRLGYTVRELCTRAVELWALRALGDEILASPPGADDPAWASPDDPGRDAPKPERNGPAWLREHLSQDYVSGWSYTLANGDVATAVITQGLSRWHNYYLEGLAWLLRETGIDGLYLDDIGYDRRIMQRVRRILARERPGGMIDLHSWNHFNSVAGMASCANLYMEMFPYLDSLWFGESFNYDESPDYWLVEISGLPFGLFGEMLEGGGNPWRGMVYGITRRCYQGRTATPIWQLWDDFGIQDAEMIGYWDAACPVRTNHPDVLATIFRRNDRSLVALASWAADRVNCRLEIDWPTLGLDATRTVISAPHVSEFQPAAVFGAGDSIPVQPGRGWLLVLQPEPARMEGGA